MHIQEPQKLMLRSHTQNWSDCNVANHIYYNVQAILSKTTGIDSFVAMITHSVDEIKMKLRCPV